MSRSLLGLHLALYVKVGPTRAKLRLLFAMFALWANYQAKSALAVSRAQQANSL